MHTPEAINEVGFLTYFRLVMIGDGATDLETYPTAVSIDCWDFFKVACAGQRHLLMSSKLKQPDLTTGKLVRLTQWIPELNLKWYHSKFHTFESPPQATLVNHVKSLNELFNLKFVWWASHLPIAEFTRKLASLLQVWKTRLQVTQNVTALSK